ncbi:AfsR/SARP family transcriptional regulator [Goodfellowiella coeruleoviolacea]|uniref:DNA-binding transcriptional activator of the SARP family n=1 Tax=Goodfellowiella coeruleoviolacea TaxID=334858 RepID=A0AAE3GHY5_9PSEU|nr:BTAD domain-containing putative transcriptional regulator [Goodfellowiella coeruleoviolacea]MCP2168542.1 DNA-binding transcriptional activator of the SARP family [Goodfellowiella coeruleoviolacea]
MRVTKGDDVRLGVLGRLHLRSDNGEEIAVPRGKTTALLVALVAGHGRPVTRDRLIRALWGDDPPRTSGASLHNHVAAVRSVLARATPGGDRRLRFVLDGYQLDLAAHECDLIEFERLIADGRAAAGADEQQRAARALRQALRLWRGTPSWHRAASSEVIDELVRGWEHARLTAHEDCLAAELRLGHHAEVIGELRGLIARFPLREQPYGLLMRALWLVGERAEALDVYQAARRALASDLGVEPGPRLTELRASILRGDAPPSVVVPRQLPADTVDFTGRQEAIARTVRLLTAPGAMATVTLTGQPGAGKTALAVRVAHLLAARFPDGQLYVSLGGGSGDPRPPGEVLTELLRALNGPDAAVPVDVAQRAAAYRSRLAGRRVLVILDDAANEAQVRPLLPGTPGNAVLVTSRRLLVGLPGARGVAVPPLTRPEALMLLTKVLGAARVAAEPEAATELVDRCGRLPLAITVVVARLATRPQWSLASLLARMRDQRHLLDELAVAELDVRAGFAVSYEALGELERLVFRRFALAGTAELAPWALAALADDDAAIDQALHHLLTSHLIEPASGEHERYTMHDLVRVFAAERVEPADGVPTEAHTPARAAFRRLFDRTRALIEVAFQHLPTPAGWLAPIGPPSGIDPPAAARDLVHQDPVRWCAAENDTLLAVLTRAAAVGWGREALDAAERLSGFLSIKHRMPEVDRLYSALVAAAGADRLVAARAKFGQAHGMLMGGRVVDASAVLAECASAFEELGEDLAATDALVLHSFCLARQGELAEAGRLARRALDLGRAAGDQRGQARALRQLGDVQALSGQPAAAVGTLTDALDLCRRVGEADLEAVVVSSLARAHLDLGALDQADQLCRRAVTLLDELDQPVGRAHVRLLHSRIAEVRGQHREAVRLVEASLHVFRRFGDRRGEAQALHRLAVHRLALGQAGEAAPLLRSARALCAELGMRALATELAELADAGAG